MPRALGRQLLPEVVVFLGELGACAIYDPNGDCFYDLPYRPGLILCCKAPTAREDYSRELFILRPVHDGNWKVRRTDQLVRALGLHSRFVHKRSNDAWNCIVPAFRFPRFAGELAIVRYTIRKNLPGVEGMPVEWEHYFNHEDGAKEPAYAPMYAVGTKQFYIPRGPFRVGPRGIESTRDH